MAGAASTHALPRWPLAVWLLALVVFALAALRVPFVTDMSVFLPRHPSAEQRLIVDHLAQGPGARVLLIGIDGVDPQRHAALSEALAAKLRASADFAWVGNGAHSSFEAEQRALFEHRYLLSPRIHAEAFEVEGLRERLREGIASLAGVASMLPRELWLRDPTGEFLQTLGRLDPGETPRTRDGVWVSRDGTRPVLLARLVAAGTDLDAQQRALAALDAAVADAAAQTSSAGARAIVSGAPLFAVESREQIRDEITRLSTIGLALIAVLLAVLFRSPRALVLTVLPLATAVAAGLAAVALGFGAIHGLTVAFGVTLIGEAVDYALYTLLRSQGEHRRPPPAFWATIRLGVATSIVGFAALLWSGFPGLAQMAVFSIAGLLAAALATRHVLPVLLPSDFRPRDLGALESRLRRSLVGARRLRWPLAALLAIALAMIAARHDRIWDPDVASLNPITRGAQQLHDRLRDDIGSADSQRFVLVAARDEQAALEAAETLDAPLQRLVERGVLAGFESPARFLPSLRTQQARLAALPPADELERRLALASEGLPIRASRLAPFAADVAAARTRGPLTRDALAGTQLAARLDALLLSNGGRAIALLPLRAPAEGEIDRTAVADALPQPDGATVQVLDLKAETDRMYASYVEEAVSLSLLGALAIVVLLAISLRDGARLLRLCLVLAAAVALVIAGVVLAGTRLNLLHLVGLLLVVAIGSNYALFFLMQATSSDAAAGDAVLASLLFANLTTVAAFGVLATSSVPLLSALGTTVGGGAALALLLSAVWLAPRDGVAQRRILNG